MSSGMIYKGDPFYMDVINVLKKIERYIYAYWRKTSQNKKSRFLKIDVWRCLNDTNVPCLKYEYIENIMTQWNLNNNKIQIFFDLFVLLLLLFFFFFSRKTNNMTSLPKSRFFSSSRRFINSLIH